MVVMTAALHQKLNRRIVCNLERLLGVKLDGDRLPWFTTRRENHLVQLLQHPEAHRLEIARARFPELLEPTPGERYAAKCEARARVPRKRVRGRLVRFDRHQPKPHRGGLALVPA